MSPWQVAQWRIRLQVRTRKPHVFMRRGKWVMYRGAGYARAESVKVGS